MKKMVLIAASFLLNTTCVKYDCFAMNKNHDSLYRDSDKDVKMQQQQQDTKKEQSAFLTKMLNKLVNDEAQAFKKNPKAIFDNAPAFQSEFIPAAIPADESSDLMDKVAEQKFESYRAISRGYIAALNGCAAFKKDADEAKNELLNMKTWFSVHAKLYNTLQTERDELKDKNQELEKKNAELCNALEAANHNIDELKGKNQELEKKNTELCNALEAANHNIDEVKKHCDYPRNSNQELSKKNPELKETIKDLEEKNLELGEERINSMNEIINRVEEDNRQLEESNKVLKTENSSSKGFRGVLGHLRGKQSKCNSLKTENSSSKDFREMLYRLREKN